MHTLVVVEEVDVAEQVTQFLGEHGISVHHHDFDHSDQATIQCFQAGEIPILITTVEEDFYEEFIFIPTNVLVDVPLFITDQYSSYKDLIATSGAHLTFYVDNDNWLSVAYIIKQLLEQGISLTTDPNPSSPNCPSSPASYPSHSKSLVSDNCSITTVVPRSNSPKLMADDSVCLSRLDSLALAQLNVDKLKYESARLGQQIQKLSCKLNVPLSHIECGDMAPELVDTDSNHPCTEPQVEILRFKFVHQNLDSAAKDLIYESTTQLPNPKATENYVPSALSKFPVWDEETLVDLEELQQTCHVLLAKLQDCLPNDKGPLSSDEVGRYDVSSPSQEKVALIGVFVPHHPPVSDGKMYADTSWYLSHKNCEEPKHPEARCQASTITQCDHILDVLLGSSWQLLKWPRAGLNGHRSAPNDHTRQSPPGWGFPPAYQAAPTINYVSPGRPCPQVDSPSVVPPQSSCCTDKVDNVLSQSHDEYLDTQAEAWTLDENMSNYEFYNNHLHPSVNGETTHCCECGCQQDYHSDPMLSDPLHGAMENPPGHLPVLQQNLSTEAGPLETMAEEQQLAFPATQPMESQVVMAKDLARLLQELHAVQNTLAASRDVLHGSKTTSILYQCQ